MGRPLLYSKSARVFCIAQILCLLLLLTVARTVLSSNDIVYVYDELGRLVAVIDTAGETAVYSYDAVGNLLSINRYSSSVVSVIEFTPKQGVVGTPVTIYGTGFSTTASQNTVTFNGSAATVISATATRITTTVPAAASTGPIAVTAPGGNATSAVSFIVGDTEAPTITAFTPTIGTAGTSVTITGTNYETAVQNNKVKFNNTYSSITAATSTTITTSVPSSSSSGRISVSTPAGTAVSSADFFIPPAPYTPADVAVTGRMAIGESKVVTIPANKVGLIVFDGTAGQRVSLGMNGVTINGSSGVATVAIYKPTNTVLLTPFEFSATGQGTSSQVLPSTGTYSILVDPYNANTGSVTLHLSEDLSPPIAINGNPVNLTFRPGQNAWLPFTGTAGQRVSVGVNGVTISGQWGRGVVALYNPDGTVLHPNLEFDTTGHGTASKVLPVTGTYAILIDPYYANSGNVTVQLSEDLSLPISFSDPPVNLTFRPGQNAWLPFSGTAGQRVSVGITGVSVSGQWGRGVVALYNPDGTVLHPNLEFDTTGHGTASKVLPVTGTYAILIDLYYANSGSLTVTLSSDVTGTISINGSPVTLELTRAGQNGWLTFDGTAGQRVSAGINGVTISGQWGRGVIAIYNPNGTVLHPNLEFDTTGHGTASKVLPVMGTYAILIDPYYANSGNVTVQLSEDLSPPISIDDPPVNLMFRPGQNAWLPFSGTAGQRVSVGITGVSVTGQWGRGVVALYNPDGSVLHPNLEFDTTGHGTASKVLPVTGTYAILIDLYYANSGSLTVTLSSDVTGTISINGAPVALALRSGQNGWLTFGGTAGQRVSAGINGVTISGQWGRGVIAIYNPNGTVLHPNLEFDTTGHGTASKVLSVTGTYAILIDPYYANSGNVTVQLSEDLSPPITINGATVNLTFRPGQNAWLPFSGTAGQRVSVGISGVTLSGQWGRGVVALYNPDGTVLHTNLEFDTTGHGTASKVLSVTGTYAILIDPYYANSGNATVTLSEDLAPAISIGGPPVTLSFIRVGQNGRLTFNGTSGQVITVVVSNNTIGATTVTLLKPDGTTLTSTSTSNANFNLASSTLPSTGTYSVTVDPAGAATGNITLQLYDPSANVATLKADYRFENNRDSTVSGAPTLTDLGTNSFTTATVDGVSKTVLSFTQNNGLSLSSTSGLVSNSSYSIVMLFSFQLTGGYRRVSDVRNATTDGGLYINSRLNFYPHASGPTAIAANSYVQVVLTRDPIGTVIGYVNGTQQFQFTDSNSYALISSSNTIRFFRDDANAGEASPGSVARIRVYDGVLTPTQVAGLDRLP